MSQRLLDGDQAGTKPVVRRWTLERAEALEAMRWAMYRQLMRPPFVAVAAALSLPLVILNATTERPLGAVVYGALQVLLIWAVLLLILPRLMARLAWRANPGLRRPVEMELRPTEVVFRDEQAQLTLRWSAIARVADSGRVYLLYRADWNWPPVVQLIPKRAMPGPNGAADLGELLRRRVAAGSRATASGGSARLGAR